MNVIEAIENDSIFDVCIIGAGPAGLSVLSALHNSHRVLSDARLQGKKQGEITHSQLSICVIDPAKSWMYQWCGRFQALGIDFLRSPAWATPDYNNNTAITEYAWRTKRDHELREIELPKKASQHLSGSIGAGLYMLPGSSLFGDFCQDLVKSLPHTFVSGSACDITKQDNGIYRILGPNEKLLSQCRHVIFALGAACLPTIPKSIACIHAAAAAAAAGVETRIIHTYAWRHLLTLSLRSETVVVVGGGLSAVQAALLAVRRGAAKVVLVTRKPMKSRLYDLSIEWFDLQSGWHTAQQEKSKDKKIRMFEFYNETKEKRKAWVKSARDGATVPPYYLDELDSEVRAGRIDRRVDEIATAVDETVVHTTTTTTLDPTAAATSAVDPTQIAGAGAGTGAGTSSSGAIKLTFMHGSSPIRADRIILGTGSTLSVASIPLLRNISNRYHLPVVDDLPDLDENLLWGKQENFSVVGALALLQIGPESGNLSGCRRSAERCANSLGAFEPFHKKHGLLSNMYDALFDEDSSSSSDDSDEEE